VSRKICDESVIGYMETWRKIVVDGHAFEVSDHGRIKSARGFILSACQARHGYLEVAQQISGKRKKFRVHRLVGMAFCEGYDSSLSIDHINGNKLDNRPENLEWVSLSENSRRGWETGMVNLRGENQPNSKLTSKQVYYIRKLLKQGVTQHALAIITGMSDRAIQKIKNGETWLGVVANYDSEDAA
jgi:hypothetical protein